MQHAAYISMHATVLTVHPPSAYRPLNQLHICSIYCKINERNNQADPAVLSLHGQRMLVQSSRAW